MKKLIFTLLLFCSKRASGQSFTCGDSLIDERDGTYFIKIISNNQSYVVIKKIQVMNKQIDE